MSEKVTVYSLTVMSIHPTPSSWILPEFWSTRTVLLHFSDMEVGSFRVQAEGLIYNNSCKNGPDLEMHNSGSFQLKREMLIKKRSI